MLGVIKDAGATAEIELILGQDGKTVACLKIRCSAHVEGK